MVKTNHGQNAICFDGMKVTPLEKYDELTEFLKSITKTKVLTENGLKFEYFADDGSETLRVRNETIYFQTSLDKRSLII